MVSKMETQHSTGNNDEMAMTGATRTALSEATSEAATSQPLPKPSTSINNVNNSLQVTQTKLDGQTL